jgi:hypothetical protein
MKAYLIFAACLLTACASLGLVAPKTFDQQLAYGYGGVDSALVTINAATRSGLLSSTKATQANTMTLAVKTSLDAARAAETSGNVTGAANDLALATAALTALQTFLVQNGAK